MVCKNIAEVINFVSKIESTRHDLPFEIDGIVVKVNDLSLHDKIGNTSKAPR